MNLGELDKPDHLIKCFNKIQECPLKCSVIITSCEQGLKHLADECSEAFVRCQYCAIDIIKRSEMEDHHDECTSFPVNCSNIGCPKQVTRGSLFEHLLNCDFAQVLCEFCQMPLLRKDLKEHQASCPAAMTVCQKCDAEIRKKDLINHDCIQYLKEKLSAFRDEKDSLDQLMRYENVQLGQEI